MRRINILDTTLRDGEQSPGCSMNTREKTEVAHRLERLGVDFIEAGFPAASKGDFEGVCQVAATVKNSAVGALARATQGDISRTAEALKNAAHPFIHTFLATSDLHLQYKLRMTRDEALENAVNAVKYARNLCAAVEFSAEDATRSDREFLAKVVGEVIRAGATVINIPDTVGYITPNGYVELLSYLCENVKGLDPTMLSVHCHNDLGLAVSNTLAAVRFGVGQVEGTVNGIGERAGNAAIEEIAMNLFAHRDLYNVETNINTKQIYKASRLVQMVTGVTVAPTKAIVGKNAFSHESGIHQHGVLANPLTYEIISPEDVGLTANTLILGKHSGRHAFETKLSELGYTDLPSEEIDKLFSAFKALADKKRDITDSDIQALILKGRVRNDENDYKLDRFLISCSDVMTDTATVVIVKDGQKKEQQANGDGPIDAAFNAIEKITGVHLELEEFYISAVTGGRDAQGTAKVRLRYGNRSETAVGVSTNIIEACIYAYLNAANDILKSEGE